MKPEPTSPHGELEQIEIAQLAPNPLQPRTLFDDAALQELADSIREHGVRSPLEVEESGGVYLIIAGERRWRAAQLAGLTHVPCLVRPFLADDLTRLELALIENVQREDLSPADEARAYQQLHDAFGLTDEQIAQQVGKARPTITATRNLAKLPEAVINRIGDGAGQLPKRTVRQLIPLAAAVPPEKLIAIADEIVALDPDENQTADDVIFQALEKSANRLPRKGEGWDLAWPSKPIDYTPPATAGGSGGGPLVIPACKGCPFMVTAKSGWRGGDYCVNAACFEIKTKLFAEKELARVGKKFSIPAAATDETIYVVDLDYRTDGQARKWLAHPPAHLRLIAKPDDERSNYHHKDLLGSSAIALASTLKEPFKSKAESVPAADGSPETDAQRQKRLAAEEREYLARRDERGAIRKARADVAWLGLHTATLVAPQISATGSTLEFLAWLVEDKASAAGVWPGIAAALNNRLKTLESAKGKARETLLKEVIVLKMLYHVVPSYRNDWERDWDQVVDTFEHLITDRPQLEEPTLGLKLSAGWSTPPIHQTESNCWHCGKFTPNAEMTQVDRAAGWGTMKIGDELKDVYCPSCRKEIRARVQTESRSSGKSRPAPKPAKSKPKPAAKKAKR